MTLGRLLRTRAAEHPDKPLFLSDRGQITYAELDARSSRLARWFLENGLRQGDRVAIHWPNSPETAALYFAAFKAGIVAVPVNLRMKSPEIAYVFEHSGAKICFSEPALAPAAEEAAVSVQSMGPVLSVLPESSSAAELPEIPESAVAAILYTSGTTAHPKGVTHTHATLVAAARNAAAEFVAGGEMFLCIVPMTHASGLYAVLLLSIHRGSTIVLPRGSAPGDALDALERFRCTVFFSLPTLAQSVLEEQIRAPRDVSSLLLAVSGGDSLSLALRRRFHTVFRVPLRESYAMTESSFITVNPAVSIHPGSIGIAAQGVEVRIVDGEICVRGAGNCIGYWNDPEATRELFETGWLRTGDLGRREADGYFWFEGRRKQIVIRGGSNISPAEVEEALYSHPAVLEACVVGAPDPAYGEVVVAFVAFRESCSATGEELRAHVRRLLADYKVPERILFLPRLPRGLTGKVDRRTLRDALV